MSYKLNLSLFLVIILVLFCSCTSSAYINTSTDEPIIHIKNNLFVVSVNECIDILNKGFKDEALDPIPKDYEIIERDHWTVYKAMLSEYIMIRFVELKDDGNGFFRIGLSILDSFEYKNGNEKINKEITNKEKRTAKRYFEIICESLRPNFNSREFMRDGPAGTLTFNLNGMIFYTNNPVISGEIEENDEGVGTEYITVYEVISSESLFSTYKDYIISDDDIYFFINT